MNWLLVLYMLIIIVFRANLIDILCIHIAAIIGISIIFKLLLWP